MKDREGSVGKRRERGRERTEGGGVGLETEGVGS